MHTTKTKRDRSHQHRLLVAPFLQQVHGTRVHIALARGAERHDSCFRVKVLGALVVLLVVAHFVHFTSQMHLNSKKRHTIGQPTLLRHHTPTHTHSLSHSRTHTHTLSPALTHTFLPPYWRRTQPPLSLPTLVGAVMNPRATTPLQSAASDRPEHTGEESEGAFCAFSSESEHDHLPGQVLTRLELQPHDNVEHRDQPGPETTSAEEEHSASQRTADEAGEETDEEAEEDVEDCNKDEQRRRRGRKRHASSHSPPRSASHSPARSPLLPRYSSTTATPPSASEIHRLRLELHTAHLNWRVGYNYSSAPFVDLVHRYCALVRLSGHVE
jgi:hypothetical protein